jgi:hypothetical protein
MAISDLARSSTVHHLLWLSLPSGLIEVAVLDSSKINRRPFDAGTRSTRKRKRFLRLAGLCCPTFLCEFLIIFEDFYFFRKISRHSLIGLDNGAMLLLGGRDWGSAGAPQTGIWQLKEDQWSRIGELSKVWNKILKNLILVFQPAYSGSAIYVSRSVYYFEYANLHRFKLSFFSFDQIQIFEIIFCEISKLINLFWQKKKTKIVSLFYFRLLFVQIDVYFWYQNLPEWNFWTVLILASLATWRQRAEKFLAWAWSS